MGDVVHGGIRGRAQTLNDSAGSPPRGNVFRSAARFFHLKGRRGDSHFDFISDFESSSVPSFVESRSRFHSHKFIVRAR